MKKVSVIMPMYNVEKFVSNSIESVLNQTYSNFELIIIDDKSTDSSCEIASEYASKYPNIRLVINAKNSLVGYSRNVGLLYAEGEYISFIDADDMYRSDYLEKLVNALEENNVDIAMCKHRQFVGNKCIGQDNSSGEVRVVDVIEEPQFLNAARGYCWNKVYRREIFDKLRFQTGITFEDIPFTYPALILAQKIAYVDEELYHYRRNINGITFTNKRIPQRGVLDLYSSAAELDKNYQLVKQDDKLDKFMRELEHSVLYISALDASCWVKLPHKDYKRVVNLFAFLANRKCGLTLEENSYMRLEKGNRMLYFLRLLFLDLIIDKSFSTDKTDEEILEEIGIIIDTYTDNDEEKEKIKKK